MNIQNEIFGEKFGPAAKPWRKLEKLLHHDKKFNYTRLKGKNIDEELAT